ncbi:hypothetical protein ACXLRS_002902 [Citrobacter youngae]
MTNKPELTDERIHEILLKFTRDSYRLNGTETGMALGDAVFALRELQERRKACAEPIYEHYPDVGWSECSKELYGKLTELGCRTRIVYAAPQPAPLIKGGDNAQ